MFGKPELWAEYGPIVLFCFALFVLVGVVITWLLKYLGTMTKTHGNERTEWRTHADNMDIRNQEAHERIAKSNRDAVDRIGEMSAKAAADVNHVVSELTVAVRELSKTESERQAYLNERHNRRQQRNDDSQAGHGHA